MSILGDVVKRTDGAGYQVFYKNEDGNTSNFSINEKMYQLLVQHGRIKPNNQPSPGPIANTVGIIVPKTLPLLTGGSGAMPSDRPENEVEKNEDEAQRLLEELKERQPSTSHPLRNANRTWEHANSPITTRLDELVERQRALGALQPGTVLGEYEHNKSPLKILEALAEGRLGTRRGRASRPAQQAAQPPGGYVKGDCKHLEKGPPGAKYQGGKHGRVKEDSQRGIRESHHVPPKSISPNGPETGPAISMDYNDHRGLSSTGRRTTDPTSIVQEKLAKSGPAGFLLSMGTEIAEIRLKHGDKYDAAIAWMLLWSACMGYIPSPLGGKRK
jgi:hypothetical protein